MAKKRKPAQRKKPVRSPADSAAGRTNVQIEDFERMLRVVADGHTSLQESFEKRMDEGFSRFGYILGGVALGVQTQGNDIAEIKADVGTLKADVGTLKSDVDTLKSDVKDIKGELVSINAKLVLKADKSEVDTLELRVAALELG